MSDYTDLLKWRDEFPILSERTYLINNSLGAMPRRTERRMQQYVSDWATYGEQAWYRVWLPMMDEVGDLIASIIGAEAGSVMLHQNVATLTAMVLSSLDFSGERSRLVYDDMQFTSPHYVLQAWKKYGAEPVLARSSDGIHIDTQELLDLIDERTALVPISHVLFKSGCIHDIPAIVEKAHSVGAKVLLDCYQSAGSVPVKAREWGVDFVVGGSVKWLCAGGGMCYLYVREDHRTTLSPAMTGWFSHARPFKFEIEMVEAESIKRWMGGSPNVPGLYSGISGYEIINEIGVERIRSRSMEQTALMVKRADENGLKLNSPRDPSKRGGYIVVNFDGAEQAHDTLIENGFNIDYRPGAGIRVAPHFYNSDEEINALFDEIQKIRKS